VLSQFLLYPNKGTVKLPLPQVKDGRVLTDWVTASLREAILQRYFEPGEKVDQDLIAEELEVSRTPVREALKVLESEGLVEIRPHRGAFITIVSHQDIHDIYEIRKLLEGQVVRQVTAVVPESVLDEGDQILDKTETDLKGGNYAGHFESDIYFQERIFSLAPNQLLKDILDTLNNRITRIRFFAQTQPGPHMVESLQEHRAILQAIRQRDADAAAQATRTHLENSAVRLQKLIRPE
jgi:DNA-binding GntR family transcriptional regulator